MQFYVTRVFANEVIGKVVDAGLNILLLRLGRRFAPAVDSLVRLHLEEEPVPRWFVDVGLYVRYLHCDLLSLRTAESQFTFVLLRLEQVSEPALRIKALLKAIRSRF